MPDLIRIDVDTRQAWQGGKIVPLTRTPFLLLAYLVQNSGRLVTREQITYGVWGADRLDPSRVGHSRLIDVHVAALRRALGDDPDNPVYISTVRGLGYRFERGMAVAVAAEASKREASDA